MTKPKYSKKKTLILNILFIASCLGIFLFLWNAPPETTAKLPYDQNHQQFYDMPRKEAEQHCMACHNPEGVKPLSEAHPPTYRCLFCHKKEPRPQ